MFTFRRLTIIFFIVLLTLNLINLFTRYFHTGWLGIHPYILYMSVFTLYFGISFAMAFLPCSNFHHPVLCKGQATEKVLALTFDDGPDTKNTPLVLKILRKHNIPATFFCIGKNLIGNEKLIMQIINQGHLIGNHSFGHSKWFDFLSARKIRMELLLTDDCIRSITGKTPRYFRPPFGVVNPMVSNALKGMHWQTVCWNIRSLDTMITDHRKISGRILHRLKPGSIILLHDHSSFSASHLDGLLSQINMAGYRVIPLDQLLNKPSYV